jgi:hypothetical protein
MMAFGGKSVKGVVKEKKDLKADLGLDRGENVVGARWPTDVIARPRRKRQAKEKRARMKILGGRMAGSTKRQSTPSYRLRDGYECCWRSWQFSPEPVVAIIRNSECDDEAVPASPRFQLNLDETDEVDEEQARI